MTGYFSGKKSKENGIQIEHNCLEPIKNQSPKYLRLPYLIFNDIDLIVPVGTDKFSNYKLEQEIQNGTY